MRKSLLAVAFLGALSAASVASAAHFEMGIGAMHGRKDADGTWYQSGNPYTMKINNISWYAGVTGHPFRYLAWHADYVHLGTYSENSWDTSDYSRWVQGCTGPHCSGGWYHFVGSGMSQGIQVTVGPTFGFDHVHASVQAGPFFYRSTWNENVYAASGALVGNLQHMNRIQVGDVMGVSLRYRAFQLSLARYIMRAPQDRYPPLIYGATTVSIGYRF